jgi:hypothetical protein
VCVRAHARACACAHVYVRVRVRECVRGECLQCGCVCNCVRALGTGFTHDTLALKEILLGEGPSLAENPLWTGFLKVTAHTQDARRFFQGPETSVLVPGYYS